eukprot:3941252-Amphidinium_carterae.1
MVVNLSDDVIGAFEQQHLVAFARRVQLGRSSMRLVVMCVQEDTRSCDVDINCQDVLGVHLFLLPLHSRICKQCVLRVRYGGRGKPRPARLHPVVSMGMYCFSRGSLKTARAFCDVSTLWCP